MYTALSTTNHILRLRLSRFGSGTLFADFAAARAVLDNQIGNDEYGDQE
jgi:hypothetical protein